MTIEPNYMKKLQKQNAELEQELKTSVEVSNSLLLKYHNLKQDYKQKIEDMKSLANENVNLQNALYTQDMNEQEADDKIKQLNKELYNKSNKVIELQLQLYDAHVMKTRLLKILNETSDHT